MPEDVAELQHLERAQSILDAQSKVTGADPALVGELAGHVESSWDYRGSLPAAVEIRIDGAAPGGADPEPRSGPRNPAL
jgi:hypothetical protein